MDNENTQPTEKNNIILNWSLIWSISFFSILVCFDVFLYLASMDGTIPDEAKMMAVHINISFILIIFLPSLLRWAGQIKNESVKAFLNIPKPGSHVQFTDISSFLGDQALGAFLASVLIYTYKIAIDKIGLVLGFVCIFIIFAVSLTLILTSWYRFVYHFNRYGRTKIILAAISAGGVAISFAMLGVLMAPS